MTWNLALIGQEAGSRARTGRDPQGTDRAPQGWSWSCGRALHPWTTHSSPCRASGARFAVHGLRFPGCWACPGITHPGTHPLYPTLVLPRCTAPLDVAAVGYWVSLGACTYDRFWQGVGEPRGVEHSLVSGSRAGLYLYLRFTRPFDWN